MRVLSTGALLLAPVVGVASLFPGEGTTVCPILSFGEC
jgi:hypothetical protein